MVEERANEWFDVAPVGLSDHGWDVDAETGQGSLSHRPGPWGSQLLRADFRRIPVSCAEPTAVLVRPEARHLRPQELDVLTREELLVHIAPGDAVLRGTCELGWAARPSSSERVKAVRRFVALFGNIGTLWMNNICETELAPTVRHQLRRNFPAKGDATVCSHVTCSDGNLRWAMRISRADGPNTFRICLLWTVPICASAHWLQACLEEMLGAARQHVIYYLNHASMAHFRKLDKELYVILSINHFRRGPPLLPHAGPDKPDVRISSDWLGSWSSDKSKFNAASYIQQFLRRLGHAFRTFDTLDGQKLVPYQAALRRDEWEKVGKELIQAFSLQKAAYRRLHGGCQAPDLKENNRPTYQRRDPFGQQAWSKHPSKPQLVVRRTFIDIDDREDDADDLQMRKTKSLR
ncbi:unnamed protein product [Effrenium voratum]|uniref:Uncharacterized protein n=1 Tax=Effrenium voratum TaxID=2562239 RepID=A0AA36MKC5_9DINO|nr:unnamed protein product [Effrenium voratum]